MTILYLSNFFNHHQSPLSDAFYEALSGKYYFIETMTLPKEQIRVGYNEIKRPYILKYNQHKTLIDKLIVEADVVIYGEAPLSLIKKRLRRGKLTFHDNERRYKSWVKYLKWPIYTYKSLFLNKAYLLCASAYAARDFRLSGMSSKKCFKWGYFTKVDDLPLKNLRETNAAASAMLGGDEAMPAESMRYAMAMLAAGPMLFIFPFFQKYFCRGLTVGSVKG